MPRGKLLQSAFLLQRPQTLTSVLPPSRPSYSLPYSVRGPRRRLPARARLPPPPTSHSFPPCPAAGPGRGVGGGRRSQQPLRRRLFAFHAVAGLKGSGRDLSAVRLKLGVYPAAKMEGPLSVFGDRSTGEAIRSQNGKGGRGLGLADGGAVPLSQPARSGPAAAILALSPALPKRV